jgi:quinol-cytochrome oxidoreductase complex cytochrome b subunit
VRLRKLFPFLFVIGVALMVPFEEWYTRLLGMGCLIAFVVVGVFVIASPEFLAHGDPDVEPSDAGGPTRSTTAVPSGPAPGEPPAADPA